MSTPKPGDPYVETNRRVVFTLRVTADDLEVLRALFEAMDPESPAKPIARRVMKQVKKCAAKLGFAWVI